MKTLIHNDWQTVLEPIFESPEYARLHEFLKEEYTTKTIYPEMHHIFQAFEWTPFHDVKVVILGQDLTIIRIRQSGQALRLRLVWHCRHRCKIFIRNYKAI